MKQEVTKVELLDKALSDRILAIIDRVKDENEDWCSDELANAIAADLCAESVEPMPTTKQITEEAERRYASWDNGNADRWVKGFKDGAAWALMKVARSMCPICKEHGDKCMAHGYMTKAKSA